MAHLVIDVDSINTKEYDSTDSGNASFGLFDIMHVHRFVVIWLNALLMHEQRSFCKTIST